MRRSITLLKIFFQCSVTCGRGTQAREVVCRGVAGEHREGCEGVRPTEKKECKAHCSKVQPATLPVNSGTVLVY